MTISYQFNVATASFAGFPKLLARWKGSVYKLVFKEVLVYATLYIIISAVYRCALSEEQRRWFEKLCLHMDVSVNFIPLTFVLGFYVSFVVGRWWDQWSSYPWPDRLCLLIILYINGSDEKSRMIRRTLVRYLNASTVMLTRSVSIVAKKRFPTFEHLVEAGLLTKEEFLLFEKLDIQYAKFWVPLVWFTELLDKARQDGLFHDPSGGMKQMMDEVMAYRDKQGKIWAFDYVSVPIVYTQVVTLATYSYFVGCLFSRQFLDPAQSYENYYIDIYVPFFTLLQFFFYVGWLKVAESLINPWGEDDDDFEVNWFIDRHLQVSFAMVDDMHGRSPKLEKDKFWNEQDIVLPYTQAALDAKPKPGMAHLGSTLNLDIPSTKERKLSAVEAALGHDATSFVRRRSRKMSRQEDVFAYLPKSNTALSCQDITLNVPQDVYKSRRMTPNSSEDPLKFQNGYLVPGYPTIPDHKVFETDEKVRKISSPARTMFYVPDKETGGRFTPSIAKLGTLEESDHSGEKLEDGISLSQSTPLLVPEVRFSLFPDAPSVTTIDKAQ